MKIRQALKIGKRLFLGNLIIDCPKCKNSLDCLRAKDKAIRYQMNCKGSSSNRSWDLFWSHTNRDKLTRTWIRIFFKKIDR